MSKKKSILDRSLQAKLVLVVGICLVVVGGVIIAYSAIVSYNSAVANAKVNVINEANLQANQVEQSFNLAFDTSRTLSNMLATYKKFGNNELIDRDYINALLKDELEKNPGFFGTYTLWEPNFDGKDSEFANTASSDASGQMIPYWNRGGTNGAIRFDIMVGYNDEGTGDFYLIPKNNPVETIIDPFPYPVGDTTVLMASLIDPIVVNGKFYGITGVDLSLDSLQKFADEVDISNKTGQLELISNNGTIAAATGHPERVNTNIQDELKDAKTYLDAIQKGEQKELITDGNLVIYNPVYFGTTTTPWSVRVSIPYNIIIAKAKQDALYMILIAVALILAGLFGIWFLIGAVAIKPLKVMAGALQNLQSGDLNRDIPQAVKDIIMGRDDEIGVAGKGLGNTEIYLIEMAGVAGKIAEGNLTVTVTPRSEKDELGIAFKKMVENLRDMITQVAENAKELTSASNELATVAEQAGHATNQIATTIQQVASGITQQTDAVNKTATSAEQMDRAIGGVAKGAQDQSMAVTNASTITNSISTAIQQVTANAQTSAAGAAQAAETAKKGAKTIEDTLAGMQQIKNKVGLSSGKVQEMGQRSNQINAIVETIDDIASQTNLLALNAAIEAARAGEHGKGFAVVADEVRKLAERSSIATKEIGTLIHEIQTTVAEAVKAMNESAVEVENGVSLAEQSGQALSGILKAAEMVNRQAEEIAAAASNISVSSNELVDSMDSVSSVVEENTASTEEMSASSAEVTQAIESIASVSEENSAAVEEVSASTEEMSAQVQEVTASAVTLANMAETLNKLVARFVLSVEKVDQES